MIPYIENFYTKKEADELFEFIKTQPFVRPPNPRNKTYRLRRLSFLGYSPPQSPSRAGRLFKSPSNYDVSRSVAEAPELYRKFAAKLSAYAGKEINYLSTMGYLTDDHMGFHQHEEDKRREDQTVWVLSLGAVHPVAIRPEGCKDKSQWEIIHPAHGSLYILPSEYNLTHEHAVLEGTDYSYSGLRIAINTKHIPPGLSPEEMKKACSRPAGRINSQSSSLEVGPAQNKSLVTFVSLDGKLEPETPEAREMREYTGNVANYYAVQKPANPFVRKPGPPRIYSQRKGKKYPPDAVNVDRDTIFGNHNKHHLDTHAGRLKWSREVAAKMKDAEFAASVESLRGKDLLCWCSPKQVAARHCHAIIWLELANAEKS